MAPVAPDQPTLILISRVTPYSVVRIPVPDGTHRVRLRFAEIVYSDPGHRQFDVAINGREVLTHFDPGVAAGGWGFHRRGS